MNTKTETTTPPAKPIIAAGFKITFQNGESIWADENEKPLPGTAHRLPNEYPKNAYGKAFLGDMRGTGGARVDGGMGDFNAWRIPAKPAQIIQEWDDSCSLYRNALGPKTWYLCVGSGRFPCPTETAQALIEALDLRFVLESPYAATWATMAAHCRRALEDGNMLHAHVSSAKQIISGDVIARLLYPEYVDKSAGTAILDIFDAGFGVMPEPVWTQEHRDWWEMKQRFDRFVAAKNAKRAAAAPAQGTMF